MLWPILRSGWSGLIRFQPGSPCMALRSFLMCLGLWFALHQAFLCMSTWFRPLSWGNMWLNSALEVERWVQPLSSWAVKSWSPSTTMPWLAIISSAILMVKSYMVQWGTLMSCTKSKNWLLGWALPSLLAFHVNLIAYKAPKAKKMIAVPQHFLRLLGVLFCYVPRLWSLSVFRKHHTVLLWERS